VSCRNVVLKKLVVPLTHYRPAMPFGNRKIHLIGSSLFSIEQLKKYHPSGNLKLNNLGFFQSLKLRILLEKILAVSLNLNFTPNTLGCYGLNCFYSPRCGL